MFLISLIFTSVPIIIATIDRVSNRIAVNYTSILLNQSLSLSPTIDPNSTLYINTLSPSNITSTHDYVEPAYLVPLLATISVVVILACMYWVYLQNPEQADLPEMIRQYNQRNTRRPSFLRIRILPANV
jgi:hypothetical protein